MGDHDDDASPTIRYYRSLLDLNVEGAPEELLEEALRLLVQLTGAREGYIEVDDAGSSSVQWSASFGCDPARVSEIRRTVSHGIMAHAIASGKVVVTAAAHSDPRFEDRESVRDNEIEAVICAPVGRDELRGVVYVQGGAESLKPSEETEQHVAYFGRVLIPFVEANLARLRPALEPHESGPFARVGSRSRTMRGVIERLRFASPLDVDLLFTGPTGVGKSMLARLVHGASRRAAAPFVEVNCAALPEALFENELFGAEEGAHSSVPRGGLIGKVEAAEGGTLFLDEVADLTLASQAKLLTLLQSRTYYRLGGHQPRRANVRVLAASNVDLLAQVAQKRFREDLFYRLNVLEVRVPPLSARVEDLPFLAAQLVRVATERHGLPPCRLSPGALRALLHADWPGNVRELAHRLESAALDAHMRGVSMIEARDVLVDGDAERDDERSDDDLSLQEATRRFQKRYLLSVLEASDWNISETARRLDVARSHAYNLMRLHGLERR
jgi:Nif-specific regulatory protein